MRLCFDKLTSFPKNVDELSDQDILKLIMTLRGSEVAKTSCGRRLIAWVDNT